MSLKRTNWTHLRLLPLLLVCLTLNSETRQLVSETLQRVFGVVCQQADCGLQATAPESSAAQPLVFQGLSATGVEPAPTVVVASLLVLICLGFGWILAEKLRLGQGTPRSPPSSRA